MSRTFLICLFLILFAASYQVSAQYILNDDNEPEIGTVGVGLGQNFGGLGFNGTYYVKPQLGGFVGIGYAVAGMGVNVGVKARLIPEKVKARPYALVMYGYNAAVAVLDNPELNKLFYGFSFGAGIDLFNPRKEAYWSLGLGFPIRDGGVDAYIQDLEDQYGYQFTELLPITFSIGYNMRIE